MAPLTLHNEHHFFSLNAINQYSVGTKNRDLKPNPEGPLTIYVQADEPPQNQRANWLPAAAGKGFSLYRPGRLTGGFDGAST